ncbi:MAG: hypothetical protein HW405_799, partial [Candidatus Berkelbacteria bacterium]|nr:hypothetical protein [Candidatus Berkelbacteria bacterium]
RESLKKKIFSWILISAVFIIVIFGSFFFAGRLGAEFVLNSVEPLSLFRDGKYLVLFQNNSELRSSGGFIGSYAVIEIKNYEVKNITFNTNIYALDRTFAESHFIAAPEPLSQFLKNKTWTLKDANYDANFPDAAQDILYFYSAETGDSVDGVIALNAKVMVDLLKLTGPIKIDKYNLTVDADNFYDVTQYQVERGYYDDPQNWIVNEPKGFLKDLYPEIVNRALKDKKALLNLAQKEISQKEIIFYFNDAGKEQIATTHNWAGKMPTEKEVQDLFDTSNSIDYLYINSNSYSGDKSSIKVNDEINYKITRDLTGKLLATIKITKIHTGSYNWPDGPNDTWMRIYVPKNSVLNTAKINEKNILTQDLTVSSENDKTFFGYKVFTNPGQANILEFSYYLPFDIIDPANYHLLIQKQPGAVDPNLMIIFADKILYQGVLNKDIQI